MANREAAARSGGPEAPPTGGGEGSTQQGYGTWPRYRPEAG